ncbi:MAG: hypothetical protein AAFU82_07550 [Pseudomonadota bacterium]
MIRLVSILALVATPLQALTLVCRFDRACFTGDYRCEDADGVLAITDNADDAFGALRDQGPFVAVGDIEMIGGDPLPDPLRASISEVLIPREREVGLHTQGRRFEPETGQYGFVILQPNRQQTRYLVSARDGAARFWSPAGRFGAFIYHGNCEVYG